MKVFSCAPTLYKRESFKFISCEQKTSLQRKSRKTNNAAFKAKHIFIANANIR